MSDYIPTEIQREIMLRLPVRDLCRCRQVCKSLKSCIDARDFRLQYRSPEVANCSFIFQYKQDMEGIMYKVGADLEFRLVANSGLNSVNLHALATSEGIWCFICTGNIALVLWNPTMDKNVTILCPLDEPPHSKKVFGFGVSQATQVPTIVCIKNPVLQGHTCSVSYFTMRTRVWISLETEDCPRGSIRISRGSQAVVAGRIYWVCSEKYFCDRGQEHKKYMILSFGLDTHQFTLENIPQEITNAILPPYTVSELNNHLIIAGNVVFLRGRVSCGWALEVVDGLLSLIRVSFFHERAIEHVPKLLGFSKNEDPIFEVSVNPPGNPHILETSDNGNFVNNLGIEGRPGTFIVGTYKESLFLLNSEVSEIIGV